MIINTFKLEEYLAKYEFKATYLLCCSDVERWAMQEIIAMADSSELKLWNELRLGYTEIPGLPLLKSTIAEVLYPQFSSQNILCFAGAEEGIFCALATLCQKGDHVIVFTPCYQSLMEIPRMQGCEVTQLELKEENRWKIDIDAIKKAIKSNTKCVIINFLHNPTGQVITQKELEEFIQLLDKQGIWFFEDEVYRLLG